MVMTQEDNMYSDAQQVSTKERIKILEDKVSSLEESLYKDQVAIDSLNLRMEQFENSFLDEVVKSTKSKLDEFRNYLADKLKP